MRQRAALRRRPRRAAPAHDHGDDHDHDLSLIDLIPPAEPAGGDEPAFAAFDGEPDPPPTDAAIESRQLAGAARRAAYRLKAAHPQVVFTSGRRELRDQARAMSQNVARERDWIERTYRATPLRQALQDWVDAHPEATDAPALAEGLMSVFAATDEADVAQFSRHLAGLAFDVQPVDGPAGEAIKATIRALPGLRLFLEKEGGLVRWHAEF
jgi:hypothetical protein